MKFQYITSKQMADVDKVAMDKYGIDIKEMMENAGRNLAEFVADLRPKSVVVLYGKGNNGGGGLVAARHLDIKGIKVSIVPASKDNNENVEHQLGILEKAGIKPSGFKKGDVIIDALLGYNLKGSPRKEYAELIDTANSSGAKIVSLDLPSGMNPDTGEDLGMIEADYVLTLALPKMGLKNMKNVYLVNIGIPKKVYGDLGIEVEDYFTKEDVVRV